MATKPETPADTKHTKQNEGIWKLGAKSRRCELKSARYKSLEDSSWIDTIEIWITTFRTNVLSYTSVLRQCLCGWYV